MASLACNRSLKLSGSQVAAVGFSAALATPRRSLGDHRVEPLPVLRLSVSRLVSRSHSFGPFQRCFAIKKDMTEENVPKSEMASKSWWGDLHKGFLKTTGKVIAEDIWKHKKDLFPWLGTLAGAVYELLKSNNKWSNKITEGLKKSSMWVLLIIVFFLIIWLFLKRKNELEE